MQALVKALKHSKKSKPTKAAQTMLYTSCHCLTVNILSSCCCKMSIKSAACTSEVSIGKHEKQIISKKIKFHMWMTFSHARTWQGWTVPARPSRGAMALELSLLHSSVRSFPCWVAVGRRPIACFWPDPTGLKDHKELVKIERSPVGHNHVVKWKFCFLLRERFYYWLNSWPICCCYTV